MQPVRAQSRTLAPPETMVVENLPEIPAELVADLTKYTEARGAGLADWHPQERAMLINTRFANTNQIHWVAHPGRARTQLTFFQEPVGAASFEPQEGRYFLSRATKEGTSLLRSTGSTWRTAARPCFPTVDARKTAV